ncbi:MAG: hypothetical protein ACRCWI_02275 [Brevinema sp.]
MKTKTKELREILEELKTIKELNYDQVKLLLEEQKRDRKIIIFGMIITLCTGLLYWFQS